VIDALRRHWPEYLIEASGLGVFMIVACVFGALIEYPASPVRHLLPPAWLRRIVMGFAIGVAAMALIDSPWGRRSGAHLNPAASAVDYVVTVPGPSGAWQSRSPRSSFWPLD